MKFQKSVIPVAALAGLGSALVIPELNGGGQNEKRPEQKDIDHDKSALGPLSTGGPTEGEVAEMASQLKQEAQDRFSPLVTPKDAPGTVDNRYIVLFKKDATSEEVNFHRELVEQVHLQEVSDMPEEHEFFEGIRADGLYDKPRGGVDHVFDINGLLKGYSGYFPAKVVDVIRMSPIVELVEEDSYVFTEAADTENGAPWGLARISHRDRLNLGSYNKYLYDNQGGSGVTAYVIDTGVNIHHEQFGGRARWGKTIPQGDDDEDGNGHGTHVAGTVGSATYGVAKDVEIVAVKVLRSNGSGTMSDVLKGVEWAAEDHLKSGKQRKGSSANMSLGGGKSPSLDQAVNAAVNAGLNFAVAAGNEDQNACNTSPAGASGPITVGASTLSDDRAYFSNWGKCVDVFAPGLNILSTYIGSNTATATLSGTSMASPHVAGLLAYFLSLQPGSDSEFFDSGSSITPSQLKKKLLAFSTENKLSDIPSSTPNLLIYNGGGGDLSGFWGSKEVSEELEFNEKVDLELHELVDELGSKTDAMFGQIRGLMDRLDLI